MQIGQARIDQASKRVLVVSGIDNDKIRRNVRKDLQSTESRNPEADQGGRCCANRNGSFYAFWPT
jgi:hypothetical protein